MSKAFDYVVHELLLDKLEKYGIRGHCLSWIKTYLYNRQQCVEVHSMNDANVAVADRSNYRTNKFGVPQGSVLGPILFLIYINDLPKVTNNQCIMFADDISVIVKSNNSDDLESYENDINVTVNKIIKYLNANNLNVNLGKTNFVNFNIRGRSLKDIKVCYDDKIIARKDNVTFLGIDLNETLNFATHVHKVCNKINRFVYVLRRLTKKTSLNVTLSAYHGYVASNIAYGLILWGNGTDVHKVFVAQKKCIRAICGKGPFESCRPLFVKLGLLTVPCMYILEAFKFVNQHSELFKRAKDLYPRNTRDKDRLVLEFRPNTSLFQNNCYAMCIKIYNKIPNQFKCGPSKVITKKLRMWLTEKCFYSVREFLTN